MSIIYFGIHSNDFINERTKERGLSKVKSFAQSPNYAFSLVPEEKWVLCEYIL